MSRAALPWILLAAALHGAAAPAGAAAVHEQLRDALRCKGDALGTVQALVDGGSRFAEGYAVASIGAEIDTQALVVLDQPLEIGGATTHLILAGPSAHEEGFGGLVYARFRGDHLAVVKALGLEAHAPKDNEVHIGDFQKLLPPADGASEAESVCPPTIGLTPLEGGEFLLGCGWCNG